VVVADHPLAKWAARISDSNRDEAPPVSGSGPGTVPKQAVLYLHVLPDGDGYQTQYQCEDCFHWIADIERCVLHERDVAVRAKGSCGFFLYGDPDLADEGAKPGVATRPLTVDESGYEENEAGFSCKRCAAFLSEARRCNVVSEAAPGDDPGAIHPDACCAAWRSGKRSGNATESFARRGSPTRA
jgi:hypothetical protein